MERGLPPRQQRTRSTSSSAAQAKPSPALPLQSGPRLGRKRSLASARGVSMGSASGEAADDQQQQQQQQQQQHELLQELLPRLTNSSERAPQINVCMRPRGLTSEVDCCLRYPGLPPIQTSAVSGAPLVESVGALGCGLSSFPCGGPPQGEAKRAPLRATGSAHSSAPRIERARQAAATAVLEAAVCLPLVTVQLRRPPHGGRYEANGRESSETDGRGPPKPGSPPETTQVEASSPSNKVLAAGGTHGSSLRDPLVSDGSSSSKRLRGGAEATLGPPPAQSVPEGPPPIPLLGAPVSPAKGPLLVLLGGSSGSGKSTLLPLLLQLLCRTFAFLEGLPSWREQGGGPRPYVLLSTDALRQILRALCPVKDGPPQGGPPEKSLVRSLLFSSTYALKDLATAQLQGSLSSSAGGAAAVDAAAATGTAAAAAASAAAAAAAGEEEQGREREALRQQIEAAVEEELGALRGAPQPTACQSCGEEAPCCALLGMLQQAVLLQQVILEPLVKSLMGPPEHGGGAPPESQAREDGGPSVASHTGEGAPLKLVLVEGVHLTPAFSARMQRLYGARCLSLVAYCFSKEEHARRLANREEGPPAAAAPGAAAAAAETAAAAAAAAAAETAAAAAAETVVAAAVAENFPSPIRCGASHGLLKGGGPHPTQEATQGAPESSSNSSSNKYIRALSCIRCVQLHLCLAAASTLAASSSSKSSSLLRSNEDGLFLSEAVAAGGEEGQQPGPTSAARALETMLGASGAPKLFPRTYAVPTDDLPTSLRLVHQAALAQWVGGPPQGALPQFPR